MNWRVFLWLACGLYFGVAGVGGSAVGLLCCFICSYMSGREWESKK